MDLPAVQARILDDIRKYGCHVIQVQGSGPFPPFAYSVGIGRTSDSPDVCVFGLPAPASHRLLHHYNVQVHAGKRFESGQVLEGYIKDADCALRPVDPSHHEELFGFNVWLHDGARFEMLQLVYPSVEGIWPWSEMAEDSFRQRQPILENVTGPH